MVGDSRIDYETAKHADARCCLVSYGFSGATFGDVPLSDVSVAADIASLSGIIGRFLGVRNTV